MSVCPRQQSLFEPRNRVNLLRGVGQKAWNWEVMAVERINVGWAIVGTLVGIASLGFVVANYHQSELFGKKDRFFCLLNEDTQRGGKVWTVMYRQNKKKSQPWLKMVTTYR